jgi:hypothetical protein
MPFNAMKILLKICCCLRQMLVMGVAALVLLCLASCTQKFAMGHSFRYAEALLGSPAKFESKSKIEFLLLQIDRQSGKCLFRLMNAEEGSVAECWVTLGDSMSACPMPGVQGVELVEIKSGAAVLRAYVPNLQ